MKFLKIIKIPACALIAAFALNLTATSFAISSTANNKVKDYKLTPANGKVLRYSDISIAERSTYAGARPRVTKRQSSMNADCYDVKFLYKNVLKRVSFNCSNSGQQLTMLTK